MSVDLRTRQDGPTPALDAAELFGHDLPDRLDASSGLVVPGLRWLDPRDLAIETDAGAWTLTWDGERLAFVAGSVEGAAAVRLPATQLDDLVYDREGFMGLFSSGRLDQRAGRLGDLLDWWLVLRALLDERPVYTPGSIELVDGEGAPLDLQRSFRPDDDPEDMRAFLEEAGYLHITGLFTEAEMHEVSADMDRAAPTYARDDGRSWWAKTDDGADRLVRMQGFDHHSAITAALIDDRRFLALGEITGDGHVFGKRRADNKIEALVKPIGVVEGISDVPWHKDCSLGRHSYECCSLTVGISVTGADQRSGQLRVVAGSHRALVWPAFVRAGTDLPQIDLPTSTGDVTIHLSCTTHMAQPPVERERRVMYTGFSLPVPESSKEAAAAARAQLRAIREAAPVTVSQVPATRR
jgi:hypothetical protein